MSKQYQHFRDYILDAKERIINFIRILLSAATIQHFFHWRYSGVFIPSFWTGVIGMIGIASAIENSKPVFILAYIFACAGLLWSLGYWLTSNFLGKKCPNSWTRSRKKLISSKDWRNYRIWRYLVSILILVLFVLTCFFIHWVDEQKELSLLHGWLYPASDPLPPNACNDAIVQQNGLLIYFGGQIAAGGNVFPHTVLEIKKRKIISIDKRADGALGISVDIFSRDGKIVARLEGGKFIINQANYLEMQRIDKHSLRIVDASGNEVLNIRFFNPHAIWLNAELYYPDLPKLINLHGSNLEATSCSTNSGVADILIN